MEAAVTRIYSGLNRKSSTGTGEKGNGSKEKIFMPSSHTYPVTAGFCPAVTFCLREKNLTGSSRNGFFTQKSRCPEPAPLRLTNGRESHLGSPRPGILLANYDMHFIESGHHNHLDRQAFERTVWGVTQGHLPLLNGRVLHG